MALSLSRAVGRSCAGAPPRITARPFRVPQDVLDGLVDSFLTKQRWNRLHTYGITGNCRDLQLRLRRLLLEDRAHFPSGGDYFVEAAHLKAHVTPFMVHNNQIHGNKAKVARFQRANLWYLDSQNRCRPKGQH